ncbi:MAG: Inorganic pyrophosphatase [Erysipelotrichaceae bacterium]|nr:Inorganic pyrophosphatase [Erysipelotrichaceae bacterium]
MNEFQNNAYFWQKIDTLVLSGDFIATAQPGDQHPDYPNLVFPCAYGYIGSLNDEEAPAIHVFKGKNGSEVNAVILAADILNKSMDVKLLIGCSSSEEDEILRFLNQTEFQKTVIMHRGYDVPDWAVSE